MKNKEADSNVKINKISEDFFEFLCSECLEVCYVVKLGIPEYLNEKCVIFEGLTHAKAVDIKYAKKIFKFIEKNEIMKLHYFLIRKKLLEYGIDAFCPDCNKVYCKKDYHVRVVIDDEGFYDYTEACCPKMSERIIDD